ncbi:hypothetical protein BGY98DRAFT_983188 [Russula aff. rugulosa BPL654]|nr:hypothetical protein BGY98DRAFT_983188 [Russula aff. rugulosa BPL654]
MTLLYFDPSPDIAYFITFHDLSAAVLLYYDYVLTLPREIQFLWPPHNEQGWFTLACLINRYIPVIGKTPIAVSYFIPLNTAGLHTYHEWFMIAVQIGAGILCLLRVYALYGRSRRILGLLLFIGMGSIVPTLVGRFPLTLRLAYAYPNIILIVYQGVIILNS